MAELDLKRESGFPFWLYCNVLAKLPLYLLHALKKKRNWKKWINYVHIILTKVLGVLSHAVMWLVVAEVSYLHAFEEPKKDLEPLEKLGTQLCSPHCGFTDQNVPGKKNKRLFTHNKTFWRHSPNCKRRKDRFRLRKLSSCGRTWGHGRWSEFETTCLSCNQGRRSGCLHPGGHATFPWPFQQSLW